MKPTMADLLAEKCEHFTRGTCADPGSGKIPDSDTGTWNQYCSPCRLRFAWAQQNAAYDPYTRELYEKDMENRQHWNLRVEAGLHLPIQSYEDWRDEHLWADALRTRPFLTFEEWKAEQS